MKSNRKRLSLLASSSLVVASLLGGAGIVFTPASALAADECGNPDANATAADTFVCTGTFPSIVYPDTNGNLTLNLANDLAVTTGGLAVNGTGSNFVTIGRTNIGSTALDPVINNTAGAGISIINGTGAATINLTDPAAATGPGIVITGTTYGVRMESSASGGGTFDFGCFCTLPSPVTFTQTNGSITATGPSGIGLAAKMNTTSSGNMALTIGGLVTGNTGVQAETNGTGSLSVTVSGANGQVVGGTGPAIQLDPNAAATVTLSSGSTVRADGDTRAVIEVAQALGTFTLTNSQEGVVRSNDPDAFDGLALSVLGGAGAATITLGANEVVIPSLNINIPQRGGDVHGRILLENTGAVTFNVLGIGAWRTAGDSFLGDGATLLTLGNSANPNALLATSIDAEATTIDFGNGDEGVLDIFNQAGVLAVGTGAEGAAALTLANLEHWNVSGTVLFGSNETSTATDGVGNDVIVAEGVQYRGSGLARLMMDVDLSGTQTSCETPSVADCLILTGATTFGETSILVNDAGDTGFTAGKIVLVDVGGGVSAAGQFLLDPGSSHYAADAELGGILDRGLYFHALTYDEATQQHFLATLPKRETLQLSTIGEVAQSLWRATTSGRADRGDLGYAFEQPPLGTATGAWLKIIARTTDRDLAQSGPLVAYTGEAGYDQDTRGLVGGVDLVGSAGEGAAYAAGVTAGYVTSDATFKNSTTEASLTGPTLGAYGTFALGSFFLDAIVNATWLDAEFDAPGIGLTGDDLASGKVRSMGAQAEAGYRLPINDGDAYFEPLAALAYVTTDVEDFTFTGGKLESDDVVSFRGSLGGRMSGEMAYEGYTLKMALTARHWQEFEGENRMTATSATGAVPVLDDVTGNFNEVNLDFGLYSGGAFQNLSIRLGADIRFSDDYKDSGGSLGFRYQW